MPPSWLALMTTSDCCSVSPDLPALHKHIYHAHPHNHTHTPSHSQDLPITFHTKGHRHSKLGVINSPCTRDEGPKAWGSAHAVRISAFLTSSASSPADSSPQSTHGHLVPQRLPHFLASIHTVPSASNTPPPILPAIYPPDANSDFFQDPPHPPPPS